jgi:phenylacetate-CoA ligase
MHDYKLGRDRIAWFSGRHLIGVNDVSTQRFWRNNFLERIRYYSTFHMAPSTLTYYVEDLAKFRPRFLNGFPSAISELASFIEMTGAATSFDLQAIFTTRESLTGSQRDVMERVFNCPVRNQYASSEGAPFIMECQQGRLHIDVTSGVFEVVDADDQPSSDGEVLVTSFYMKQTPLIRYRIGDRLALSLEPGCPCGWDTPLAASIEGRESDFLEIPGRGKIFAAQIGDCVKHLHWVIAFRCRLQDGRLCIEIVADRERFEKEDLSTFLRNIRERMGDIPVDLEYLDELPRLPSGKRSVIASTNQ